jgi:hypothetical protein
MCEARGVEVEKARKDGSRNDGTEKEDEEAIALSRPFERAVDSIVAAFEVRCEELEAGINLEVRANEVGT